MLALRWAIVAYWATCFYFLTISIFQSFSIVFDHFLQLFDFRVFLVNDLSKILETELFLDAYMPYLTLRDKISQNLAHLEANSHKIFQILQNAFSDHFTTHFMKK